MTTIANQQGPRVGGACIFTDPKGEDHNALITAVWGEKCVNLIRVSDNENEKDNFGRQIKHDTSVPHVTAVSVHGYYFRFEDEEKNPYVPPIES